MQGEILRNKILGQWYAYRSVGFAKSGPQWVNPFECPLEVYEIISLHSIINTQFTEIYFYKSDGLKLYLDEIFSFGTSSSWLLCVCNRLLIFEY